MNSPDLPDPPPDDDVLAGEFVLGVLDAEERRRVQARVDSDRVFAARVAYWERRFAPWLSDIEPVEPPEHVWTRVRQRLGWRDGEQASRGGLWASLSFWRAVTLFSVLVAVVAVWMSVARQPQLPTVAGGPPAGQAETGAKVVTPLAHDDGTPGWLASVDRSRGTVLMVPVPSAPDPQGRIAELWLIPAGQAPRSLGQVSIDKSHTVVVPADVRAALVTGSVLAITLEPPAGLPHAAPSGPIIAKGAIRLEGAG
jgi:anti-sigma-K factor RskA